MNANADGHAKVPSETVHQPAAPQAQPPAAPIVTNMHASQYLVPAGTPQVDAAALLMSNPHTAAVVATVAAAAAQQMAQQQHHQHSSQPAVLPQHVQHVAAPIAQPAVLAPSAQVTGSTPAPATAIAVAPAVAPRPAPTVPVPAVSPHLAALLGMVQHPHSAAHSAPATQVAGPPVMSTSPPPATLAVAAPHVQHSSALIANMQNWKLEQLEQHVKLLRDSNQPVPQAVALLLADSRRKEEKRTAKRVANRKSASTSRARKKALVEEMTRTNARLKRQALILALLPDLVIAITVGGEITFCSAQVERVLRHSIDDLVGANLADLLIPASREAMFCLIRKLVAAEKAAKAVVASQPPQDANQCQDTSRNAPNNENGNNSSSGLSSNGAAVVSDQSFPMVIVNVDSQGANSGGDNSDLSTSNADKNSNQSKEARTNVSSNSLDGKKSDASAQSPEKPKAEKQSSSDDSLSSSSDAKNLRQANENLNRNVRSHNEKLLSTSKSSEVQCKNNADARLSSLKHIPDRKSEEDQSSSGSSDLLAGVEEKKKKKAATGKTETENSSDDSGYRESNESAREDTSSSASDASMNGRRPKPLAPTANICLIRNDMTTIWCEVTSSIRTRSLKDEANDGSNVNPAPSKKSGPSAQPENPASSKATKQTGSSDTETNKDEIKELLLCLRPIRDGAEKVDESLRFTPKSKAATDSMEGEGVLSSKGTTESYSGESGEANGKKREAVSQDAATAKVSNSGSSQEKDAGGEPCKKKAKKGDDRDKSIVAESLVQMSNKN